MREKECPCSLCDEPSFMSREEVSGPLGIHMSTVTNYVKDGYLPEYLAGAKTVR